MIGRASWARLGFQIRRGRVRSPSGLLCGLGLADGERGEEAKAQLGASPGDHAFPPSRVNDRFICDDVEGSIPSGGTIEQRFQCQSAEIA